MKLKELLTGIPVLECTADPELEIKEIFYDSRKVTPGSLFVAVSGFAADGKKTDDSPDLFIPTETALRSLGLSICGKPFTDKSPWQKYKPLTEAILKNSGPKDPAVMDVNERK